MMLGHQYMVHRFINYYSSKMCTAGNNIIQRVTTRSGKTLTIIQQTLTRPNITPQNVLVINNEQNCGSII